MVEMVDTHIANMKYLVLKESRARTRPSCTSLQKEKEEVNVMNNANTALISASTGMGVADVGILSTIVAIPMAIGLEIGAVVCGVGGVISKFISRRQSVKARKHDSICVLSLTLFLILHPLHS